MQRGERSAKRVKRTYNLSPETVRAVKELQSEYGAGPTQDAVVERAIRTLVRHLRDESDARLWAEAGADPAFNAEVAGLQASFAEDEAAAWPG